MSSVPAFSKDYTVLIGTYTSDGRSKGIYQFSFGDAPAPGIRELPHVVALTANPSFLAYAPLGDIVYATGDTGLAPSGSEGLIRAFSRKTNVDGMFTVLGDGKIGIKGAPCHVAVSSDCKALVAAHYNEGIVYSWPLKADGSLGTLSSRFVHEGKTGPNAKRQERPHAHSFTISPDHRFAFACDLGLDRIVRYALDTSTGALSQTSPAFFGTEAGQGPRHSKFSPDGRHFYVVSELAGTVSAFSYNQETGELVFLQTISALAPDFKGDNTSAEIQVHPSGRFVYASNRGPDTITVYARDSRTGLLSLVEHVSSGGGHPRHFALSPDGAYLLCANRDGNNVVLFLVNQETGRLQKTSTEVSIPSPVCVLFVP